MNHPYQSNKPLPVTVVNESQFPESQLSMVTNAQLAVICPAAAELPEDNDHHPDHAASDQELPETGSDDSSQPPSRSVNVPTPARLPPSTVAFNRLRPGILFEYRMWLAEPRASIYTTASRRLRTNVTQWTEIAGPPTAIKWEGDINSYTWPAMQRMITSLFAEQVPDVGPEICANIYASEARWHAIISNHMKYGEGKNTFLDGPYTWGAFREQLMDPSSRGQRCTIRYRATGPPRSYGPGRVPPKIVYLPKENHDTDYQNVEEIKEAIVGIARQEAGNFISEGRVFISHHDPTKFLRLTEPVLHAWALAMKHDPSSRITWSCPPEGPNIKWETIPPVNPPRPAATPALLTPDLATSRMASPDIRILSPQTPQDVDACSMRKFLRMAFIGEDDMQTRNRIAQLKISHWSYFTLSTEEGLRALGFSEGPARLLCLAVDKARAQCL